MKIIREYLKRRRLRHANQIFHELVSDPQSDLHRFFDTYFEKIQKSNSELLAGVPERPSREELIAALDDVRMNLIYRKSVLAAEESAAYATKYIQNAKYFYDKFETINYALDQAHVDGFIAEFGVYQGRSLNFIADKFPDEVVHGFDTFTGLPENWVEGFPQGRFDTTGQALEFRNNCKLHKGLFSETLPGFLAEVKGPAKFIHIDCDLYASTIDVFNALKGRIVSGTVIEFDEYFNYPGWQEHEAKAWHEFVDQTEIKFEFIAYTASHYQAAVRVL